MYMKTKLITLSAVALLISGCASAPTTHAGYMNAVKDSPMFAHSTNKVVNANYSRAVSRVKKQLRICIPDQHIDYPVVGSMIKTGITITNYKATVKKVASNKTEITLRSKQSNMLMQPDDGFIVLASDIRNLGKNRIRIKSVSAITTKNLHEAIVGWSQGSHSCYGIMGKD